MIIIKTVLTVMSNDCIAFLTQITLLDYEEIQIIIILKKIILRHKKRFFHALKSYTSIY